MPRAPRTRSKSTKLSRAASRGETAGLPGRAPAAGEEIDGLAVVRWLPQRFVADAAGLTTRQLQNLEKRGLPCVGYAATKEYPAPHVFVWLAQWGRLQGRNTEGQFAAAGRLPLDVALARHRLLQVEHEAGIVDVFGNRLPLRR